MIVFAEKHAAVAEQADAQDLKSCGAYTPYGFDSRLRQKEAVKKVREYTSRTLFTASYFVIFTLSHELYSLK